MILTGKAKINFLIWLGKQGVSGVDICNFEMWHFDDLSYSSQYAIIIEWLDNVGIYAVINHWIYVGRWSYNVGHHHINTFTSRQEATKQAILKANELYNEQHK